MYVLLVYKVVTPNIYQGLQIVLFSICVPIGSEPEFSHRTLIKVLFANTLMNTRMDSIQ